MRCLVKISRQRCHRSLWGRRQVAVTLFFAGTDAGVCGLLCKPLGEAVFWLSGGVVELGGFVTGGGGADDEPPKLPRIASTTTISETTTTTAITLTAIGNIDACCSRGGATCALTGAVGYRVGNPRDVGHTLLEGIVQQTFRFGRCWGVSWWRRWLLPDRRGRWRRGCR